MQNPSLPTRGCVRQCSYDGAGDRVGQRRRDGLRDLRQSIGPGEGSPDSGRRDPPARPGDGGIVDPTASKSIAVLVFLVVFAIWCWFVLFASRLRANLRAAKLGRADEFPIVPEPDLLHEFGAPHFAGDLAQASPVADATSARPERAGRRPIREQPSPV